MSNNNDNDNDNGKGRHPKNDLPFVVGAGLGRTGTHSLRAALEKLGYSKTFHMKEILEGHTPPDKWFALAQNERTNGHRNRTLSLKWHNRFWIWDTPPLPTTPRVCYWKNF